MPKSEMFSRVVLRLPTSDVIRAMSGASAPPSDEELLGFKFKPGDRVVVLDTGEIAEVIRGRRINNTVPVA